MADLRETGQMSGGPAAFSPRDRSAFLSELDRVIRRLRRNEPPRPEPSRGEQSRREPSAGAA
jgi:uncharacterized protein